MVWTSALCAIIASGPVFIVGCTLGFPSAVLLDLDLSSVQSDLFGALAPIGAIFGSFFGGLCADYFGRKVALLLVAVPYIIGYLMMSYSHFTSNNTLFMGVLFCGRFFTGIGLGWSCSTVPVYHAEISYARVRGLFCSFTQLFLSFGLLVIYLLSTINKFHYFDICIFIIGIITVYEIFLCFIPESPRWLVSHGCKSSAENSLKKLRGTNYCIDDELSGIERDLLRNPHIGVFQVLYTVFTKKNALVPMLVILIIMFLQQMSGLNASSAYAALIFRDAGVSNPSQTASYAVGGVSLIFTFLSIFLVDQVGRKILLIISGIGMFIGTVLLGTHFYVTRPSQCLNETMLSDDTVVCNSHIAPLAIVSLMLFGAAFSIGWGPIPWILIGELLPMHIRGIGSSLANIVNWGTAAVVTGFYFNYSELVNNWFAWWTFSLFNFCGILFAFFFVAETKGKVLEKI